MRATNTRSGQADLAIVEWGDGASHVVALHPGVGDSRIWQWCAPAWAESGHHVVAYDRRGFGETEYQPEPHDALGDLMAVMDATNAKPAVIVGNSLGGGLALDLALIHPDRVRALVLIAPSPSGYPTDEWPLSEAEAAQDQLVEDASESGDLELVNRLEIRYWLDGTEQDEGRVSGAARELMRDMNGRALNAGPVGEAADGPPAWPRLAELDVPTLVVAGGYDLPGVLQICSRIAELAPRSELAVIDKAAHCPSLDAPDELNRLILRFLGALPPTV